ncbi:MAG: hypothetical protein NTV51_11655 [Verrucomicrobia bacterium]|nr:hypothetical protein [Verrucomicrobiota bacterium]
MKRLLVLVLGAVMAVSISGCGQKLSGRYEMEAQIPRMPLPKGTDPKLQRQMDDAMTKIQNVTRQSLEFDGSTVKMGNQAAVTEYKYRVDGQKLEILVEAMGQKTTLPMTIEADGSITYMGMSYRKVR